MLGHAITTELQLLAARERAAVLSDSYGKAAASPGRHPEQSAEHDPCCPTPVPLGRSAGARAPVTIATGAGGR